MSGLAAAAVGVGTAVGGYLGGREARKGAEAAADAARFVPTDITTPFGSVDASRGSITATLPEELQQQYQGLLSFGQQRLAQAQDPSASLGFLSRTFGPQLERQRLQQESRLFNQGLLGSTAGSLQTEALRQGQNQALLEAALAERDTAYSQGLGLLSGALDISNLPQSLIGLSGNIGSQQASAGAAAGQALAQAANMRGRQINSIFSGLGQAAGAFLNRPTTPQPPSPIMYMGATPGTVPTANQFAMGAPIPRVSSF